MAIPSTLDEFRAYVEKFEARCHDVVSLHGGRIIKSLGDSVLFVSDDAVRALDIADGIIQVIGRDARMPDVRVGLASGGVVMRMGDVFGRTVNLASRLTALANPGTVMVDSDTAKALEGHPDFALDVERTRAVRGMGLVRPGVVRRTR